jgi:hypothetical protein
MGFKLGGLVCQSEHIYDHASAKRLELGASYFYVGSILYRESALQLSTASVLARISILSIVMSEQNRSKPSV